jgi:hypothetical protein
VPLFWELDKATNWYSNELCNCGNFQLPVGFKQRNYTKPPTCRNCNQLANCVTWCVMCKSQFYDWFSHPMMGYHSPPFNGFMCWDCLEKYWFEPAIKPAVSRKKVAPLAMLLPPIFVNTND